jgi:signal recognition particle GTPase
VLSPWWRTVLTNTAFLRVRRRQRLPWWTTAVFQSARSVDFRAKDEYDVFDTLSDRLATTFKNLRGKGKLSQQDIDETLRAIRQALLEADVSLQAVRPFIAAVRERAEGAEVSKALNPDGDHARRSAGCR